MTKLQADKPASPLLLQALRLMEENDGLLASAICTKILADDPQHLPALEIKAKALWKVGAFGPALQQIEQALVLNPYDPGYHFLKGDCLQHLGRYGEALSSFERAAQSEEEAMAKSAQDRIRALSEAQEELVAALLHEDKRFKVQYEQDPAVALRARGFYFPKTVQPQLSALANNAALWARPS